MRLEHIEGFHHLTSEDLQPIERPHVFFDPVDTEIEAWIGADLIKPGCTVLDLGSGSGAATAAFVRSGAGHAHGIDISADSVTWARAKYRASEGQVSFAVADFVALSTHELIKSCPTDVPPSVVVSNPPYAPLPAHLETRPISIDGGPDGLKFVPAIIKHATALQADLALMFGSYASLQEAVSLVDSAGFLIRGLTLTAHTLGEFSRRNLEQILALERRGQATLWRPAGHAELGYLIIGLTSTKKPTSGEVPRSPSPEQFFSIVSCACSSATRQLEALRTFAPPHLEDFPVRIVTLPPPARLQYW